LKADFASGDACRWAGQKACNGKGRDTLARTTFTDETDGFSGVDGEGNTIEGAQGAGAGGELQLQVADFEQWLGIVGHD
jgi:hypothetical protein